MIRRDFGPPGAQEETIQYIYHLHTHHLFLYTCLLDLTSAVYTQIMQTQHAICLSNGMIIKKNKQRRRKIIFPLAA